MLGHVICHIDLSGTTDFTPASSVWRSKAGLGMVFFPKSLVAPHDIPQVNYERTTPAGELGVRRSLLSTTSDAGGLETMLDRMYNICNLEF
jgi:hypothetical protein